jgi:hypothetical protein
VLLVCAALPTVFLPKRWLDIKPGRERAAVHAVLDKPDADFSVKSFDGWHNPFGLGASVLTVDYDEHLSKVVSTRIRTVWGFEYRDWVQEYKEILMSPPRNDSTAVVSPESASNAAK